MIKTIYAKRQHNKYYLKDGTILKGTINADSDWTFFNVFYRGGFWRMNKSYD